MNNDVLDGLCCSTWVFATLSNMRREYNPCAGATDVQVVKMSLFNTFSSKSVRLEEFEQVQFAATDSVANHLRDNWTASIKSIIKYVVAGRLQQTLPRAYCVGFKLQSLTQRSFSAS